jgi:thiamine pyrophosphokinase
LGGRFDQTLANILLLAHPAFANMRIDVIDGDQIMRLLKPGSHRVDGERGDTVSLIPLATADGITTRQLQYPLRDETLFLGPARGISNVMLADSAAVEFSSGLLLLVRSKGRA